MREGFRVSERGQGYTVRVPATTANLGVGFDVLGLALNLFAEFDFEPADALTISGCAPELADENNLVWQSYLAACEAFGLVSQPLAIHERTPIPAAGGLGSSSACIVAGIVAAQALAGRAIDRTATASLATRLEGHPDNVAPAVMGGLVSSYVEDDATVTCRWPVSPTLSFVCMAPPYRVLTSDARLALPAMVARDTVSWQVGRCLAMVSALASGNARDIERCCHDRIHEPYRSPLIPDFEALRAASLEAGAATFIISGSGATMLAIATSPQAAARIEAAAAQTVPDLWLRTLAASEQGATVIPYDRKERS